MGWFIGFGDDEMVEKMFKKVLEINFDGIDFNYFYGDFLVEDGWKVDVLIYLKWV